MSKLVPLSEAIGQYIRDGDTVYAAGFTHLIPFAAGHEIIRRGLRDLVLARATPDLIYDQMVAAGCARKAIFSYMGNPGVGSLRIMRAEIEARRLEWEEYSHFGKEVITVPALQPDVAIVHVQRADVNGNAHLWGIIGEQKEVAFAARRVILTAEEIVDEAIIRSDPNRTLIPGFIVDAVCHVPYAAHLQVQPRPSATVNYGAY